MAERSTVRELKHESGRLLARIEQVDGKPHGLYQEWSLEGSLAVEAHFKDGQHHGDYRSWWGNGKLKEEGTYRNGQRSAVIAGLRPMGIFGVNTTMARHLPSNRAFLTDAKLPPN